MSLKTQDLLFGLALAGPVISALHAYLNVNWAAVLNEYQPPSKRKITVAYHPRDLPADLPGDRLHLEVLRQPARSSCRACFRAFPRSRKR